MGHPPDVLIVSGGIGGLAMVVQLGWRNWGGAAANPCLEGMILAMVSAEAGEAAVWGILDEPGRRREWIESFDDTRKKIYRHFNVFDRIFCLMIRTHLAGEHEG